MNSFSHHRLRHADVTVNRQGKAIRIEVQTQTAERITIEIENGSLRLTENADAALARKTAPAGTVHFEA